VRPDARGLKGDGGMGREGGRGGIPKEGCIEDGGDSGLSAGEGKGGERVKQGGTQKTP